MADTDRTNEPTAPSASDELDAVEISEDGLDAVSGGAENPNAATGAITSPVADG